MVLPLSQVTHKLKHQNNTNRSWSEHQHCFRRFYRHRDAWTHRCQRGSTDGRDDEVSNYCRKVQWCLPSQGGMKEPGLLQVTVNLSMWLMHSMRQEASWKVSKQKQEAEVLLQRNNAELKSLDSGVRLPGFKYRIHSSSAM